MQQSRLSQLVTASMAPLKAAIQRGQPKSFIEFVWLAFGQFITLLLSLVSIKYITSIGPKDYGVFILLTSITTICLAVYFTPYEQAYVRFLYEYSDTEMKKTFFLQKFLWGLFKSISATIGIFLVLLGITRLISFQNAYLSLIALGVIILPLANTPLTGMLNALRFRREVAVLQIAEKALQVGILFVSSLYRSLNYSAVLWAIGTTFFCFMLVRIYILSLHAVHRSTEDNDTPFIFPPQLKKDIALYMGPFIVWGIFTGIQGNGERWIVQSVLSTADVGRYGLAFSLISSTVIMTHNILSQYFTPLIFESFSAKTEESLKKGKFMIALFRWSVTLTVVLFAITYGIFGEAIIGLVSTKDFHVGGWFLFTLTGGIGVFYIAQVETIVGLSLRQSNIYLVPKILASTCSIVVYILGCIYAGLLGTSVAVLLVNSGYLLSVLLLNRRILRENQERSSSLSIN